MCAVYATAQRWNHIERVSRRRGRRRIKQSGKIGCKFRSKWSMSGEAEVDRKSVPCQLSQPSLCGRRRHGNKKKNAKTLKYCMRDRRVKKFLKRRYV